MARNGVWGPPEDVPLACGHVMRLRPAHKPLPGTLVWCGLCKSYTHRPFPLKRDLDGLPVPFEWHWKCLTNNRCNTAQTGHGASEENAKYSAARHSQRHPTHEVWLIGPTGAVVERWGPDSLGAPAPLWETKAGVVMWKPKGENG